MAELAHGRPGQAISDRHDEASRRDFLTVAGSAIAVVGAACIAWPLIDSMNPSADVLAAGAPVDIDLTHVQPGQQIVVLWRSRPIFIVNRTPDLLKTLQDPKDIALLSDPDGDVMQQPAYAKNWHRSIQPQYLVLVGICTHLGCIPSFMPQANSVNPGWLGGYFCPCHGSRYDLSGRVYSGVPAPYNLPVPPYRFTGKTMIRIGENPPNEVDYDLDSIVQI
ncbi:MAG TPA: ubiquinol-cytochrome c reductase iron-sulfur subunit [Stellaceae bacterium]|jgi:ubiquinol-cytochrome c reductase iron-sulfur subunit|nr:ubiquinol-cytochrome c reductase iron-sulfur subunit [Stellaceae bacterium]